MRYKEIILETRYAPLYHWMDADKSRKVFRMDSLLPKFTHKIVGQKGISTSRNKMYQHHNGDHVCLVLDQEKIKLTNKIVPLDSELAIYFDNNERKQKNYIKRIKTIQDINQDLGLRHDGMQHDRNRNRYDGPGSETSEEYIIGKLVPLHKYLSKIILYNWLNEEPFIEPMLAYVKKYNIPLETPYEGKRFWAIYGEQPSDEERLRQLGVHETKLELPDIETGDTVLVGKFKNRKATIKSFTKDGNNQPVLKTDKGDQKLFKPRIVKLMPNKSV